MHMVGGFVGVCVLYPAIGLMTYAFTPYSPLAVVSLVAASGYAAVLRQPVPDMLRELRASIRMHARQRMSSDAPRASSDKPEWLVGLSAQRAELQRGLRAFADEHAPENMRGWWRAPERYAAKVKQAQRDEELRYSQSLCYCGDGKVPRRILMEEKTTCQRDGPCLWMRDRGIRATFRLMERRSGIRPQAR